MVIAYYVLIALVVLLALWNLARNIRAHQKVMRHRAEFHTHVRGVYESHGLEPPDWAKK